MAEASALSLVFTCMEPKGVPMSTLSRLPFLCSEMWQPASSRQRKGATARVQRLRFMRSPTGVARLTFARTFAVRKEDTLSADKRFHGVAEKFMRLQLREGAASFCAHAGLH